jgi:peptide/nickel transport system substrate-binding protein
MNDKQRNIGRAAVYAGVIGAMAVSLIPAGAHTAAAQGTTRKIGNFDVAGRFLEVWSKGGSDQASTYVNGLPITARRSEISTEDGKAYDTQWFERAKYEAHPENKAPYDVLLGRLGANFVEGRGSIDPATNKVRNPADAPFVGVDKPADANGTTKVWFQETKHSVSGKILQYWNQYGGLQQFGSPLSEAFDEISTDGKTYSTQYFERARFEVHTELQDPYAVLIGLLGVQQYKATPTAATDIPDSPPAGVTSARPNLNVGMSQEPGDLTFLSSQYVTTVVLGATDGGLVAEDQNADFYGQDAYYVPTLENGGSFYVGAGDDRHLVTKYKIRQGIKWSDGKELTSNDAVFAYKYHMTPSTQVVSRSLEQKLFNVDNPDKYTVIYNWMSLNQGKAFLKTLTPGDLPNYDFINQFVTLGTPVVDPQYFIVASILPQHVINNIVGDEDHLGKSDYARVGHVGTGPFMVKSWTAGANMVLTPNPNYTLTAKPLLSSINIKFIPDTNQILAQLKSPDPNQGIDLATSDAFAGPSDAFSQLGPNLSVHSVPAAVWEHVDFRLDYAPFADRNVREAIFHALNREEIVKIAYLGQTQVLNTVSPSVDWMSMQNPTFLKNYADIVAKYPLPTYDFNPDKAASMLDAAGWKCPTATKNCSDGIRTKDGVKLSFELATTTGNANRQLSTQLINKYLANVGVEAKLAYYPSAVYFGTGGNPGIIKTGVCKLCLYAWVGDPLLDNYDLWDSSQLWTPATPNLQNTPLYKSDAFDQAARAFKTDIDHNKIATYAAQAQQIIMKDLPVMPLYARANIEVVRTSLQNEKTSNSTLSPLFNAPALYFK